MKKLFLITLLSSCLFAERAFAQRPVVGAFADGQVGLNTMLINTENANTDGGNIGIYAGGKGSVIGVLLDGLFSNSRFFIGDYLGVGSGFGYAKYQDNSRSSVFVQFTLQFGAQAAFHISDDLDVGVHYLLVNGQSYFLGNTGGEGGNARSQGATVRFKRYCADVTFGSMGHSNPITKDYQFSSNIRYFLDDPDDDDKTMYVGLRLENFTQRFTYKTNATPDSPLERKDNYLNAMISIGYML